MSEVFHPNASDTNHDERYTGSDEPDTTNSNGWGILEKLRKDDFPADSRSKKELSDQDPFEAKLNKMVKDLLSNDWLPMDKKSFRLCCGNTSASIVSAIDHFAGAIEDSASIVRQEDFNAPINALDRALTVYYSDAANTIINAIEPGLEPQQNNNQNEGLFGALRPSIDKKNKVISGCVDEIYKLIDNNPAISSEVKNDLEEIRDSANDTSDSRFDTLMPERLEDLLKADDNKAKQRAAKDICRGIMNDSRCFLNLSDHLRNNGFSEEVVGYAKSLSENIESSKVSFVKGILAFHSMIRRSPRGQSSTHEDGESGGESKLSADVFV